MLIINVMDSTDIILIICNVDQRGLDIVLATEGQQWTDDFQASWS